MYRVVYSNSVLASLSLCENKQYRNHCDWIKSSQAQLDAYVLHIFWGFEQRLCKSSMQPIKIELCKRLVVWFEKNWREEDIA